MVAHDQRTQQQENGTTARPLRSLREQLLGGNNGTMGGSRCTNHLTADLLDIDGAVESKSVDGPYRLKKPTSINVASYILSDYIVRRTIIHFIISSTTMNNNKLFLDIK